MSSRARIRPPALLPGDTVGIVAPASNIDRDALAAGCAALERLGYQPYFLDSIFDRDLYFAGNIERRIMELEHMFYNPNVRAILCARGGYGTNYLLPHLDADRLLPHPKPFIGYSDNTALLTWLADRGLVTFHGPMVTKDFSQDDGVNLESWRAVLGSAAECEEIFRPDEARVLRAGKAEGTLYGGCLSILVASLGTPYEIQTDDAILFLEDIGEKPYQVDRMLMQLRLAGKLNTVRGVIFGQMLDCVQPNAKDYTLEEVIVRVIGDLNVPIVFGLASGHVNRGNRVLPLGVHAELEAGNVVRLKTAAAVSQGSGEPRVIRESSRS